MKRVSLFLLICQLISGLVWLPCWGVTYCIRADGTAVSKAAATSCSAAASAMTITTHNGQTFSAGDQIYVSDAGGDHRDAYLQPPSSGSSGNLIQYLPSGYPRINCSNVYGGSWTSEVIGQFIPQSSMKLSLINGAAFVDFGQVGTLTPYLNSLITIYDSGGNSITGYIKAAGSGETYGSQLLSNTTFANTTGVTANQSTVAAESGQGYGGANALQVTISATYTYGNGLETVSVTSGMLVTLSAYLKLGTGTGVVLGIQENGGSYNLLRYASSTSTSWNPFTIYATADMASLYANFETQGVATNTGLFSVPSMTQVLTPSTTGVTITSTSGGSTYNWASIGGSFNYNDSNGYTYIIAANQITAYYASSISTAPQEVWQSNTPLTPETVKGLMVTGSFWYDSTNHRVYVMTTTGSSPAGYTMEFATRSYGVLINTVNYIGVSGIEIDKFNAIGVITTVSTGDNISKNYIHDGAGIGISVSGTTGSTYAGNIIQKLIESTIGPYYNGFDVNTSSTGNFFYGNDIRSVYNSCMSFGTSSTGNTAKDNILDSTTNTGPQAASIYTDSGISTITLGYNDYYFTGTLGYWKGTAETSLANWVAQSGEVGSISSNPLFTNGTGSYSAAGDFILQLTSPCIKAGTYVGVSPVDYFGYYVPYIPAIGASQPLGTFLEYQGVTISGAMVH